METDTGKPKSLPIKLPGLPSCIALTDNNLVCIVTARGYLFVWNLNNYKLLVENFTFRHTLLCEAGTIFGSTTIISVKCCYFIFFVK